MKRPSPRSKKPAPQNAADSEGASNGLAGIVIKTAKTHKGRKYLQSLEPQVHEGAKKCVVMRAMKASQSVQQFLKDLAAIKQPLVKSLTRKQEGVDPFGDLEPVEYLARKNLCALFCYGSTSKKRPFRVLMGRTYEETVLDMFEFSVENYKPLLNYNKEAQPVYGSKPIIICQGANFESSESLKATRNFLADFFSGPEPNKIVLQGIDHLITLTAVPRQPSDVNAATDTVIAFRRYRMDPKKVAGEEGPDISLTEIGPSFTLVPGRNRLADKDRWKQAIKLPREVKPKKIKNVTTNVLGETLGRIHVGTQDFTKLYTPHHATTKDIRKGEEEELPALEDDL